MNNSRAGLPETHSVLGASGGQEIVHLLVGGHGVLQISHTTEALTVSRDGNAISRLQTLLIAVTFASACCGMLLTEDMLSVGGEHRP